MSKPTISFEYFPPRSPLQERRFWTAFGALQTLEPDYVSITWGALGTSSQASVDVLQALTTDSRVPVAAHLTCVGHTGRSIRETIASLADMGITRFVALRGDQPEAQSRIFDAGGLSSVRRLRIDDGSDGGRDFRCDQNYWC